LKRKTKLTLKLIPLAWPICIEGITGSLVNFTDTFFLSRISDEVASSVGMLGAVLMIGYWVLPSFTSAGTSVAAQYIGAGRKDNVKPTYLANLLISVLSGILLSLLFFLASGKIGLWLGMTELQNSYAQAYVEVIAVNFIFVGLRFSYASILASKTLTRYNMAATVVTNLLNVFLNWAFLYGFWIFPQMGIHGIALATVISYAAGFLILLPIVHLRLRINFYVKESWLKLKKVFLPILKIGIPSALEPFSYTFQNMIVSFLVIKFGVEAMSANTYVLRLIQLDLTVSWSLSTAGQIIMSHYLGAGNWKEVDRCYWKVARYSLIFAAINLIIYTSFHGIFLGIFTTDPAVISTGFWILLICILIEPIRAINILSGLALKTVGDGKFSVTISFIFMWGLIPVILLASKFGFGIVGLWVCLLLDESVRAIINIRRWRGERWKNKSVIFEEKSSEAVEYC